MIAAVAALARILSLPTSQRRGRGFAMSDRSWSWNYEYSVVAMSSSVVALKGSHKKRCYSCSVNCLSTTAINPESQIIILEELSIGIDGRRESKSDDYNRLICQLQDLFSEIKTKLKNQEVDEVLLLLEANYGSVKDEIKNGLKGIAQASVLDVLALGYYSAGDIKTVQKILHTMDNIISGSNEGGTMLDMILYHMGTLFHAIGKFSDAIRVYGRCLKILEKECGKCSVFLIEPLLALAKALEARQRPREAIPVYKRAIYILEKEKGIKSGENCVPLHSLGNLLLSIGEIEEAHINLQRIMEIHKEVYGESDGRTGLAICSFARVLYAKGDVDGAVSAFKQDLEVIKYANDIPLHDDNLDRARLDLAELLHRTGRSQEGREVLWESLHINQNHWGLGHPNSVAHLMNLATSYSRSKNFVEAEHLLRTSLNIMSKSVGPAHQATSVPMVHLAVILFHLKLFEDAESLALEALQIREVAFGPDSGPVGEVLDCLVSIQAVLERDKAEMFQNLQRLLHIQERLFGTVSEEVMITLHKIVLYLNKTGKDNEKAHYLRRLSVLRTNLYNKYYV